MPTYRYMGCIVFAVRGEDGRRRVYARSGDERVDIRELDTKTASELATPRSRSYAPLPKELRP